MEKLAKILIKALYVNTLMIKLPSLSKKLLRPKLNMAQGGNMLLLQVQLMEYWESSTIIKKLL